MSKMILSLDGGGIRGAASAKFLELVEQRLVEEGTSLRERVDFYAGTSTGSLIALALATTDLSMSDISKLYNYETATHIFVRRCWMLPFLGGYFSPKYKAAGKTETLKRHLGEAKLEDVGTSKHVLAVSYDLGKRKPDVIKSTDDEQRKLFSWQVADVSSAAPTYFPTRDLREGKGQDEWLVDGGVTANNPTMCVIAEAKRAWPNVSIDEMRVLSVGTGYRSKPIDGPASRSWGGIQWFTRGHILDVLTDERVVAYQAITLMKQGTYIRVDANMVKHKGLPNPPDDEMDDINPANIEKLRAMGKWWFEHYGAHAVDLLLGRYTGPSLDRIEVESGAPRPFVIPQSA